MAVQARLFPKKILLAVHHYPPRRMGGAELLTRRLAQWLSAHGMDVTVVFVDKLVRGSTTRVHVFEEQDGAVTLRRLVLTLAPDVDVPLLYNSPELRRVFEQEIQTGKPDVVHVISGYLMGTAPLEAAKSNHVPTVVTLTDFWFLCPTIQLLKGDGSLCDGPETAECLRCLADSKSYVRALDQRAPHLVQGFWETVSTHAWLGEAIGVSKRAATLEARHRDLIQTLNEADAIVSLTRFVADVHAANGVDASRMTVKPDCLDLNDFDPVTANEDEGDGIHIGYLGQITPIKGVDILLRAFNTLQRSTPKSVQLHIHGNMNAADDYAVMVKRLAASNPNICLHGPYEHRKALELLKQMDVLVVPSIWYENSPRVILEAFAAGVPVIGANVGGIAEVVHDGKNGLLFERGSVAYLTRVLQRVVDEPALAAKLQRGIVPPRTLDEDMQDMMEIYARVQEQHD